MLRIIQNSNVAGAKSYYSTADYYTEGQELVGVWRGEGAKLLGLEGTVSKEAWDALCDNRDPATGKTLTLRQKSQRRVGWDFNFHVPKSVSLLYALTKDERLLDAFRQSVDETMRDIESEMKTRVRRGGSNEDRETGNAVWGQFIHFTSRPVDGVADAPNPLDGAPDPHLHAHCFVFNTTLDSVVRRWTAAQIGDIKRDAPYFEAVFHSRLARRLAELGLPIERKRKGWDIAGISKSALEKFSRRTALIEEEARRQGIVDPKEKAELGAKTRQRKQKDLTMDELRELWRARLSGEEGDTLAIAGKQLGGPAIAETAGIATEGIAHAAEHCFERNSVVPERQLIAEALRHSVGEASLSSVLDAFRKHDFIRAKRDGRKLVTTPEVLAEENHMLEFARRGRGTCAAFGGKNHVFKRSRLNAEQRNVTLQVLESRDRVILVRGAAGVGKTSTMQEVVEAIEATGQKVFAFAPSAKASRGVLREDGFDNAETVARLLIDESLQEKLRGQVLWIDEAGLLGSRAMAAVFDLAGRLDARVIISGDKKQHGSVERGATLSLLEEEAGLVPAELKEIQRQKGKYKQAVQALSEGRTEDGFDQLDKLGWIRESSEVERYKILADEYLATVDEGKTALVVSPTHIEGDRITRAIRDGLKASKNIRGEEHCVAVLENLNLTPAERVDAVNYVPGDVIVFHQNAKGYCKGDRLVVGEGKLPLDQAARFQVFRPAELAIAPGDLLRVTRNGYTRDGKHRLDNGTIYAVKGFTKGGNIQLSNGWIVNRSFGFLDYGYVVTSHASQGSTVDRVFIGQSSASFPASSREQFYVSVSRARQQATIYTDDKESLLNAVSRGDDRLTATELVSNRNRQQRYAALSRMDERLRAMSAEILPISRKLEREGVAYER